MFNPNIVSPDVRNENFSKSTTKRSYCKLHTAQFITHKPTVFPDVEIKESQGMRKANKPTVKADVEIFESQGENNFLRKAIRLKPTVALDVEIYGSQGSVPLNPPDYNPTVLPDVEISESQGENFLKKATSYKPTVVLDVEIYGSQGNVITNSISYNPTVASDVDLFEPQGEHKRIEAISAPRKKMLGPQKKFSLMSFINETIAATYDVVFHGSQDNDSLNSLGYNLTVMLDALTHELKSKPVRNEDFSAAKTETHGLQNKLFLKMYNVEATSATDREDNKLKDKPKLQWTATGIKRLNINPENCTILGCLSPDESAWNTHMDSRKLLHRNSPLSVSIDHSATATIKRIAKRFGSHKTGPEVFTRRKKAKSSPKRNKANTRFSVKHESSESRPSNPRLRSGDLVKLKKVKLKFSASEVDQSRKIAENSCSGKEGAFPSAPPATSSPRSDKNKRHNSNSPSDLLKSIQEEETIEEQRQISTTQLPENHKRCTGAHKKGKFGKAHTDHKSKSCQQLKLENSTTTASVEDYNNMVLAQDQDMDQLNKRLNDVEQRYMKVNEDFQNVYAKMQQQNEQLNEKMQQLLNHISRAGSSSSLTAQDTRSTFKPSYARMVKSGSLDQLNEENWQRISDGRGELRQSQRRNGFIRPRSRSASNSYGRRQTEEEAEIERGWTGTKYAIAPANYAGRTGDVITDDKCRSLLAFLREVIKAEKANENRDAHQKLPDLTEKVSNIEFKHGIATLWLDEKENEDEEDAVRDRLSKAINNANWEAIEMPALRLVKLTDLVLKDVYFTATRATNPSFEAIKKRISRNHPKADTSSWQLIKKTERKVLKNEYGNSGGSTVTNFTFTADHTLRTYIRDKTIAFVYDEYDKNCGRSTIRMSYAGSKGKRIRLSTGRNSKPIDKSLFFFMQKLKTPMVQLEDHNRVAATDFPAKRQLRNWQRNQCNRKMNYRIESNVNRPTSISGRTPSRNEIELILLCKSALATVSPIKCIRNKQNHGPLRSRNRKKHYFSLLSNSQVMRHFRLINKYPEKTVTGIKMIHSLTRSTMKENFLNSTHGTDPATGQDLKDTITAPQLSDTTEILIPRTEKEKAFKTGNGPTHGAIYNTKQETKNSNSTTHSLPRYTASECSVHLSNAKIKHATFIRNKSKSIKTKKWKVKTDHTTPKITQAYTATKNSSTDLSEGEIVKRIDQIIIDPETKKKSVEMKSNSGRESDSDAMSIELSLNDENSATRDVSQAKTTEKKSAPRQENHVGASSIDRTGSSEPIATPENIPTTTSLVTEHRAAIAEKIIAKQRKKLVKRLEKVDKLISLKRRSENVTVCKASNSTQNLAQATSSTPEPTQAVVPEHQGAIEHQRKGSPTSRSKPSSHSSKPGGPNCTTRTTEAIKDSVTVKQKASAQQRSGMNSDTTPQSDQTRQNRYRSKPGGTNYAIRTAGAKKVFTTDHQSSNEQRKTESRSDNRPADSQPSSSHHSNKSGDTKKASRTIGINEYRDRNRSKFNHKVDKKGYAISKAREIHGNGNKISVSTLATAVKSIEMRDAKTWPEYKDAKQRQIYLERFGGSSSKIDIRVEATGELIPSTSRDAMANSNGQTHTMGNQVNSELGVTSSEGARCYDYRKKPWPVADSRINPGTRTDSRDDPPSRGMPPRSAKDRIRNRDGAHAQALPWGNYYVIHHDYPCKSISNAEADIVVEKMERHFNTVIREMNAGRYSDPAQSPQYFKKTKLQDGMIATQFTQKPTINSSFIGRSLFEAALRDLASTGNRGELPFPELHIEHENEVSRRIKAYRAAILKFPTRKVTLNQLKATNCEKIVTNNKQEISTKDWHLIETLPSELGTSLRILVDGRTRDSIKQNKGMLHFRHGAFQIRDSEISLEGKKSMSNNKTNELIKHSYSQATRETKKGTKKCQNLLLKDSNGRPKSIVETKDIKNTYHKNRRIANDRHSKSHTELKWKSLKGQNKCKKLNLIRCKKRNLIKNVKTIRPSDTKIKNINNELTHNPNKRVSVLLTLRSRTNFRKCFQEGKINSTGVHGQNEKLRNTQICHGNPLNSAGSLNLHAPPDRNVCSQVECNAI